MHKGKGGSMHMVCSPISGTGGSGIVVSAQVSECVCADCCGGCVSY